MYVSVSVIIPTFNEQSCIADTIRQLRRQQPHEIIIVDGGSEDRTCAQVAGADQLLCSPRGRASQMNQGAAQARGDVLLFLHADCVLEADALKEAQRVLQSGRVAAGCFTMRVTADGLLYRSIDFCATARVRLTGLVYGDQGLFVRRALFERLGGFPVHPLMEDVFFSRRLRRQGRIVVAARRIFVSPRRWQHGGLVHQTLRNWVLTVLAAGGVPPERLARFYPVVR
jgi:rSAM/selenodomain-associated transferase 2